MQDCIFLRFRVEKEEFNYAVAKFNLPEDPHVQQQIQQMESLVSEDLKLKLLQKMFNNPQDNDQDGRSELDYFDPEGLIEMQNSLGKTNEEESESNNQDGLTTEDLITNSLIGLEYQENAAHQPSPTNQINSNEQPKQFAQFKQSR